MTPASGSETPLDRAHAALEAAGDDAGLRMAFYGQLLVAELHVLLEDEPEGERLRPLILDIEGGRFVLAFDRAERMAAFLDAPQPYAALAGRALVAMLAGRGIGIALNPEVAPSAGLIGAAAVDWMTTETGGGGTRSGRLARLRPPLAAPPALVTALGARIAAWGGRMTAGYLAAAEHADGGEGLVLALEGVPEAAEGAVAAAIDEAARFSGAEGVRLDVAFPGAAALARIARVGIAFRPEPSRPAPTAPGADPARPPRLR